MAEPNLLQKLARHDALIKGSETDSRPDPVPGGTSIKSDSSMEPPIFFKREPPSANQSSETDSRPDPVPRGTSIKSDSSMEPPIFFKRELPSANQRDKLLTSVADRSNDSTMETISEEHSAYDESLVETRPELQLRGPDNGTIFKKLEEHIVSFVKKELSKLHKVLLAEELESLAFEDEDEEGIKEAFLKIVQSFLKSMEQDKMAECLYNRQCVSKCQHELKADLKQKFSRVSEGVAKAGDSTPLTQIFTELYITEGGALEVNQEHEVRHMETASRTPETTITCKDLFKTQPYSTEPIRLVLTKGVTGVGKTVLTQKFSLDWAEGKSNQDLQLLLPFTFRQLNVLRGTQFSLVGLLHHFFSSSKGLYSFHQLQVLFIFDGLDECRLPLNFNQTRVLTDPTEIASLDVLLVNLIRGTLLPSAHLWITTRPATASQIPAECISMVTEVRGFTDLQKEQYFRKRFKDQATAIISYIKSIRSLYIMCHIPIFCWILSTVLQKLLEQTEGPELPQTLTQMYVHFLVVQAKVQNIKYHQTSGVELHWTPDIKKMVQCLGKLAFEQLQKGNLIFYERDLSECGLDAAAASVYSGVFTQVFREEAGLYQDKVYCFIHVSVQEFLAALHVHHTFFSSGVNVLLERRPSLNMGIGRTNTEVLHCSAVDQALQSPTRHLDLFLRFLLGLSLEENQRLLQGLTTHKTSSQNNQKTIDYIKKKLDEGFSPDRSLNLLHCLNELNDHSLVQQTQEGMRKGHLCDRIMSPADWSALSFILLSSDSDLEEIDLRKYCGTETALLGLLPVVRASTKALLISCGLSPHSCGPLASVLSSSSLTHLDLSNNDLQDSGVKLLCSGLKSTPCRLETLSLSGCLVSEEGCAHLTSALKSNPSHLRELDLSYNHPGETGAQLLQALTMEPHCRLHSLRLHPFGPQWLKPGLRKYSVGLTWDMDSVHPRLRFSDRTTAVMCVSDNTPYSEHPDRFNWFYQVLCSEELRGRSYFQVQWSGHVHVAVTYRELQRKGKSTGAVLGGNNKSWCLFCSDEGFSVWHNDQETVLPKRPESNTVGVYVDSEAGVLSFYCVSDRLTLLHSFCTAFTQPLVPAIGFRFTSLGSSVVLWSIENKKQYLTWN
ncbi:protein NLRC3-like isoform X2 [Periophthalmus magnuspinnatus]|uniref:protein NLRC3-like isoform X2 n=1 Tax=Periophthalmus magnuspinnatus TaxID=409849 RepID=UPI002437234B|nr:protein NLRC3-like isoform X2 [Periophthalmus magnuspinnatus]